MADAKLSELTAATTAAAADTLYLVQSATSKRITVANLFAAIATPVSCNSKLQFGGTPQSLVAPGAIDLTVPITQLSVPASSGTITIAAGVDGQVKIVTMTASSGGTYSILANLAAGMSSIQFNKIGHSAILLYTANKWHMIGGTAIATFV